MGKCKVAFSMSVDIVDRLEVIHIDADDVYDPRTVLSGEKLLQRMFESAAVVKPGELIRPRDLPDLCKLAEML
jgi:hypothetical protein